MNFNISGIFAGLIFGAFGMYFLKKGKDDGEVPPIMIGLALLIYPYFIENVFFLWGIGVFLMFLGFKVY